MGKLERGTLKYSETYTLIPTKGKVTIDWLFDTEERGVPYSKRKCQNKKELIMKLKSIEDIFYAQMIIYVFNVFEAEIQVLGLKEKQIIDDCFICRFHTFIEECSIDFK